MMQLLYDCNHFHSQYISICVFLQFRGKSWREAATACAPLTGWLSHWAVCGERLPCNYLYVGSVTFMSETVQCLHALLIYVLLLLYALAFHRLALTWRCAYYTEYAALCRTSSWSDIAAAVVKRRREAASISASMKTFHCYDVVRQFSPTDVAAPRKKRWAITPAACGFLCVAVRKNIISDRFSTKTAISARIWLSLRRDSYFCTHLAISAQITDTEHQVFLHTGYHVFLRHASALYMHSDLAIHVQR